MRYRGRIADTQDGGARLPLSLRLFASWRTRNGRCNRRQTHRGIVLETQCHDASCRVLEIGLARRKQRSKVLLLALLVSMLPFGTGVPIASGQSGSSDPPPCDTVVADDTTGIPRWLEDCGSVASINSRVTLEGLARGVLADMAESPVLSWEITRRDRDRDGAEVVARIVGHRRLGRHHGRATRRGCID